MIGKPICGSYDRSFQVTSSGRRITLKFKSDNESEYRGFKASYRTFDSFQLPSTSEEIPPSIEELARSHNKDSTVSHEECGYSIFELTSDNTKDSSPLVQGEEVLANSAPWTVHLHYCFHVSGNSTQCKTCDGSLVDPKWIVTVAQCFEDNTEYISLRASLGDHDKDIDEKYETTIEVKRVITYPGYNRTALPIDDIAMVELQHPAPYSGQIRPICLPSPDVCFPPGTICMSIGWGGAATYGADVRKLRRAQVPLYNDDSCRKATGGDIYHNSFLCGGLKRGPNHRDQCGPEAGGGLICRASLHQPWILYGIVSRGYGCIAASSPSLYTKVSVFSDWITDTMGKNITKSPTAKTTSCTAQSKKDNNEEDIRDPCHREQIINDTSGAITSDSYPESYRKNLHCVWTIITPEPDQFVMITFDEIDIEGEEKRCWDKISIFRPDGSMIRSLVCNEHKPAVPYLSKGGASIHFESDRSGEFKGFKLTYETVSNATLKSNCGTEHILRGLGSIQSLEYPKQYPPHLHCEWLLESTSINHKLELTVTAIQMELEEGCHFDFLEIYDSDYRGNTISKHVRLCGLSGENHVILSRGRYLLVMFKSDVSGSGQGFQANFVSVAL